MHPSLLSMYNKVPVAWELQHIRYSYLILLEAGKSTTTVLLDLVSSKGQVLDMPSGGRRDEERSEDPINSHCPRSSIIMWGWGSECFKIM